MQMGNAYHSPVSRPLNDQFWVVAEVEDTCSVYFQTIHPLCILYTCTNMHLVNKCTSTLHRYIQPQIGLGCLLINSFCRVNGFGEY